MPRLAHILASALLLLALGACAATDPGTVEPTAGTAERLETSPRHHEWVKTEAPDGRVRRWFLVYPERSDPAPAVVVIHENRGLGDWARSVADRLAEAGYLALAPDLLSGTGPGGGGTAAFPSSDAAREGIYALPPDQVAADVFAALEHVRSDPACNGRVALAGFCWGGSQTFRMATLGADVGAACVFYGTAPDDPAAFEGVRAPVFGFYGGDDARVNATLPATTAAMEAAGKSFDPLVYPGAGHAFLRKGAQPSADAFDRDAHDRAWERWLRILGETLD